MKRLAAFTLCLSAAITLGADIDTWLGESPDTKLIAVERRVADPDDPSRLDLDGFTVFVCSTEHGIQRDVVAQHTFPRRLVSQIRWSPDSQFLLFTTTSSGGHSSWHFQTFAYCVADGSFRDVEPAAGGSIGRPDFRFEPPDIALLKLHRPDGGDPKPIKLPLAQAMPHMERL